MKIFVLALIAFIFSVSVSSQNNPKGLPPGMTPEMLEMIKKSMPPGTKLPPGMDLPSGDGETSPVQPLIELPIFQEPDNPTPPQAANKADYSPFGSGRSEAQRRAALAAVNAELEKKPFLLPKPESIPNREYMLKMAAERSKIAHQNFKPDELSQFSQFVNWIPRFDGQGTDPVKAKEYSFSVSMGTSTPIQPNFLIALSSAVFALDPVNSVNASNFAAAILTAGEMIYSNALDKDKLAVYRRDAESGYLYAIAASMKDGEWGEQSFNPILNFGNLCIDLKKLEEARSLFMVARKLKPTSWDAALGLAAYFYAINQPDKALAILEDENLDKPQMYMQAGKLKKSLEKSEPFSDLPPESPNEKYEEGIKIMEAEPIATAADFMAQFDQSERNKMRYFIEHLPVVGSFSVPPINKLSQYATLKAISSPQGVSALQDFVQKFGTLSIGLGTAVAINQMELLERMGMKIDIKGVDMNDVAKHPEKYIGKDIHASATVTGKDEMLANVEKMKKEAISAQRDLATGKTTSTIQMAGKLDPYFNILLINPEEYADPMNIIIQKMNFSVLNRKTFLYNGYLYSLNKRLHRQVSEDISKAQKRIGELAVMRGTELEEYEKQRAAAEKANPDNFPKASWDLKRHAIHTKYFNQFNNAAETAFGSATNVACFTYVQKIKPAIEGYYYDVFRHIALISDPEIRDQQDAKFRQSINSAINMALQSVLIAHGSFKYSDDWDCSCDLEQLLAAREAEKQAEDEEENARIERNKTAKKIFDSGDIPESKPLFQKLDAYADEYNFILFKARVSCARTTIEINTDIIPHNLPGNFSLKSTTNEFTGETKTSATLEAGISKDIGSAKVKANANLTLNVTTDGKGAVKDYSVTPGANLGVKVGNFDASVSGKVTVGPDGVRDYSMTGNAKTSVTYGNTTVSGGATVTIGSKGIDSDFSAGIKQDLKNEFGGKATFEMEASTKKGCSMSAKVQQSLDSQAQKSIKDVADKITDGSGLSPDLDQYMKKTTWSGKWKTKKEEGAE